MVAERSLVPLPTYYNGVRFKSSLEARWAMYFDLMDIGWVYEDEAYRLPSGPYLPDFWLPIAGIHAEVKPETGFSLTELTKCMELNDMSRRPVLLLDGLPRSTVYHVLGSWKALGDGEDLVKPSARHIHVPGKADPMEYEKKRVGDAHGGYFAWFEVTADQKKADCSWELIRVDDTHQRLPTGEGWWWEDLCNDLPYGNKWTEFRRRDRDCWDLDEGWQHIAVRKAQRTRTGELVRR